GQRVLYGRGGDRASRRPSGHVRRDAAKRAARAPARRARLHQGPHADSRDQDHVGLEDLRAPRADRGRVDRRAATSRRSHRERRAGGGAIGMGKTNTPEFGAGGNTRNAVFGPTLNPWNLALTCGGSTGGGAVALATGMAPLAQGSDLGGSLRIPASFCGVVGLRPSPGLVPVWPHPLAWDSYGVQGPMARTVEDVAVMLAAIAGPDARSPISYAVATRAFTAAVKRPSARGLRIAWGGDLGVTPVDDEVLGIARNAMAVFRKIGARVSDEHPDLDGVNDVVLISRGARMVGLHEEKL